MALLRTRGGGLLATGPDAVRANAMRQQQSLLQAARAPNVMRAPTTVIQEENPINQLGQGLQQFGQSLRQQKQQDVKNLLDAQRLQIAQQQAQSLADFRAGNLALGRGKLSLQELESQRKFILGKMREQGLTDRQLKELMARAQNLGAEIAARKAEGDADRSLQRFKIETDKELRERALRLKEGAAKATKGDEGAARQRAINQYNRADDAIALIEAKPNLVTGVAGARARTIQGTAAYQLDQMLETLRARLSFDEIKEMREQSKTGGALGQVSNYEVGLLQKARVNLDIGQRPEVLINNLRQLQRLRLLVISPMDKDSVLADEFRKNKSIKIKNEDGRSRFLSFREWFYTNRMNRPESVTDEMLLQDWNTRVSEARS